MSDHLKVVATMCMWRRRWPNSLNAIRSLEGQMDTLYLCLNDFWEVPPELKQDWIEILHLGENLGDTARFYLLRYLGHLDAHVISCDDDFEYPKTYAQDFLAANKEYPDTLLTHHGSIADYTPDGRIRYSPVTMTLIENTKVRFNLDMAGSGASFVPKSIFNRLEFTSLGYLLQCDVHLACNCIKLGVPIIGIPHPKGYFKYTHYPVRIANTVANKSDWMQKVHKIYASYNLDPAEIAVNK